MRRTKKRSGLNIFNKLVLGANMFAVVSLLIAYLSSFISPGTFWPPAFFGLAYPAILLINLIFIIYWLISFPRYALLSLIAILAGWNVLSSYIGFRESSGIMVPKSSESFIRVLTYNVHNFKQFGDKNDKFTKDQILDIIRKEQPDVLCFQEFFSRQRGEYNFRKLITEIMKSNHYFFKPTTDNGYEATGTAIFSKYPIVNSGKVLFAKKMNWNEAVYVDVNTGKKIFRVYNVHFQSISFQPEDYQYLNKVKKDIDTDVGSSVKIVSRLKNAFVKRANQVKLLRSHADSCKTPYIIAGDFNDTPISYTAKTIFKGLQNGFHEKGSGFGVTYNGDFPNFQIDYIVASPEFTFKNYLIVKKKLSDHYPVRTDLELK
ncbi:MAG: endonuclease/exonuclease/phosphatase family protein [Bacteroidota bacterium]